jgi:type III secretory pathway component EscT
MVAAASSSAGALIDAAFGSSVVDREAVFGGAHGPFGRLLGLAFGAAFLSTGAMTHLCERFVAASSDVTIALNAPAIVALVKASCNAALVLAAPALIAQVLGTIVAAGAARAAPRVNGLMLSSPLITVMLLPALFGAAPVLLGRIAELARTAARVSLP